MVCTGRDLCQGGLGFSVTEGGTLSRLLCGRARSRCEHEHAAGMGLDNCCAWLLRRLSGCHTHAVALCVNTMGKLLQTISNLRHSGTKGALALGSASEPGICCCS